MLGDTVMHENMVMLENTVMHGDTAMHGDTVMHGDTAMHGDTVMHGDTAMHGNTVMHGDTESPGQRGDQLWQSLADRWRKGGWECVRRTAMAVFCGSLEGVPHAHELIFTQTPSGEPVWPSGMALGW